MTAKTPKAKNTQTDTKPAVKRVRRAAILPPVMTPTVKFIKMLESQLLTAIAAGFDSKTFIDKSSVLTIKPWFGWAEKECWLYAVIIFVNDPQSPTGTFPYSVVLPLIIGENTVPNITATDAIEKFTKHYGTNVVDHLNVYDVGAGRVLGLNSGDPYMTFTTDETTTMEEVRELCEYIVSYLKKTMGKHGILHGTDMPSEDLGSLRAFCSLSSIRQQRWKEDLSVIADKEPFYTYAPTLSSQLQKPPLSLEGLALLSKVQVLAAGLSEQINYLHHHNGQRVKNGGTIVNTLNTQMVSLSTRRLTDNDVQEIDEALDKINTIINKRS